MVSSTTTIADAAQPASPLERSRARSSEARSRPGGRAQAALPRLDGELGRNAAQSSSDETALRSAMDEIKRLKKALKDGEKQRRKLLTARKRAADAAAKAEERARKAEAKYDRAVLADMIQRTKEQDRRAASAKAPENGSTAPTTTPALPAPTDGVEAEDLGTATARRTAARTTARRASAPRATTPRPRTPRSPRTPRTTAAASTPAESPGATDTTSTETSSTETTSPATAGAESSASI